MSPMDASATLGNCVVHTSRTTSAIRHKNKIPAWTAARSHVRFVLNFIIFLLIISQKLAQVYCVFCGNNCIFYGCTAAMAERLSPLRTPSHTAVFCPSLR